MASNLLRLLLANPSDSGRKETPVRRTILSLTPAAVLLAAASSAFAGGLDLRVGAFFPRGNDVLFSDVNYIFTPNADPDHGVQPSDFIGVFGGFEYNTVIAPKLELGVHVDGYGKTLDTSLRNYASDIGTEITQSLRLRTFPIGLTLRLVPTEKGARFAPYVGAGVDVIPYTYEEFGDFVDTFDPTFPIIADHFKTSEAAFGVHALAGVRIYLDRDFAIVAEGRYLFAKDEMGGDFAPNEPGLVNRIDLSGASAVVGVHVRF